MLKLTTKDVIKSLKLIAVEYKNTVPDNKKESRAIYWGIRVMKQAREYIRQRDRAIELLKEFAFYCIDLSAQEHCEQAVKVQSFLREAGYGNWIDKQIAENEKDME